MALFDPNKRKRCPAAPDIFKFPKPDKSPFTLTVVLVVPKFKSPSETDSEVMVVIIAPPGTIESAAPGLLITKFGKVTATFESVRLALVEPSKVIEDPEKDKDKVPAERVKFPLTMISGIVFVPLPPKMILW